MREFKNYCQKKKLLSVSDTLLVKGSVKLEICKAIRGYDRSFKDQQRPPFILKRINYTIVLRKAIPVLPNFVK